MLFRSLALVAGSSLAAAFNIGDDLFADPQFTVQYHDRPLRQSDVTNDHLPSHDPVYGHRMGYEMMLLNDTNYVCGIPEVVSTKSSRKSGTELSSTEARDRALELMLPLLGDCLFYEQGFFSYRFCYGLGVVQYHRHDETFPRIYPPPEGNEAPSYVLGAHGAEDTINRVTSVGGTTFLAHRLRSGTFCELTGGKREIEVQFVCNKNVEHDQILWVKEKRSCNYIMHVGTPRLCQDLRFQPPPDKSFPIMCYKIESEAPEFETIDGMFESVSKVKEEQEAEYIRAQRYVNTPIDKIDEIEVAWRITKARALNYIGTLMGDLVNTGKIFPELGMAEPAHDAPSVMMSQAISVKPLNGKFEVRMMISRRLLLLSINDNDVTREEKIAWWQKQGDLSSLESQGLVLLDEDALEVEIEKAKEQLKESERKKKLARKEKLKEIKGALAAKASKDKLAAVKSESEAMDEDDAYDTVTSTQTIFKTQVLDEHTQTTKGVVKDEKARQGGQGGDDDPLAGIETVVTLYFEDGEAVVVGLDNEILTDGEFIDNVGILDEQFVDQDLIDHIHSVVRQSRDEEEEDEEDYGLSD